MTITVGWLILLLLLVLGFIALWMPKYGRALFDVAVFIILLFLLIQQTGTLQ